MELVFWISLGFISYAYFGYPAAICLAALFIDHRIEKRDVEPYVTFLITAYNEERSIARKLENTLSLDYPKERLDVMVASDGSDDATESIVRSFAARGVRLFATGERRGKTETQNRAMRAARGEIVVFSDSTTLYEESAVRAIVRNFADPSVGAVGGRFKYVDPRGTHVGAGTVAFWDYETAIKMRQTQLGTITGCSGCIYALRRELYVPLPHDIISDLVEPLKVLEKGFKIVFEPAALAYEETFSKKNDEFRMRVRVISRGMRGLAYMRRLLNPLRYPLVSFQLVSHKLLRWFVPFFAAALLAASAALVPLHPFYAVFFWLQAAFYAAALSGLIMEASTAKRRIFSLPLYFCLINIASLVALARTITRRKDITWKTIRE